MEDKRTAPRKKIGRVGVVGCGQMGSGYAQLCAQKGYNVVVSGLNEEHLKKGLAMINARLTEGISNGVLSEQEKVAILNRIKGVTEISEFANCDLVIEAVTEKMEVKKKIFTDLDKICPKDLVLATNTSVLSVLDIASATSRPDRVLGIHTSPLVAPSAEIIKTIVTSDETLEVAKQFTLSLGKHFHIVKDTPGFVMNYLLTPLLLGAIRMVENGIAKRDDIDTMFREGMGWFLGPLAMADGIGLDTLLHGSTSIYEELKEPQFIPPLLLKKMVTAGWLGIKTGKGFYDYGKG